MGACVVATLFFSGCASIISKSNFDVSVSSNAPESTVTVRNPRSGVVISTGDAPLVVNLKSADAIFTPASYMCEVKDKATNKKQVRVINASICPWFFGNFIWGGLIGMGIDAASGAMYQLDSAVYVHFSEYEK